MGPAGGRGRAGGRCPRRVRQQEGAPQGMLGAVVLGHGAARPPCWFPGHAGSCPFPLLSCQAAMVVLRGAVSAPAAGRLR